MENNIIHMHFIIVYWPHAIEIDIEKTEAKCDMIIMEMWLASYELV